MKFCVRHRDKNGKLTSTTVEAADRRACFDELSRLGISTISVSQGEAKPSKRELVRPARRLVVFSTAVAAVTVIGVCVFFMFHGAPSGDDGDENAKRLIKAQPPSKAKSIADASDKVETSVNVPIGSNDTHKVDSTNSSEVAGSKPTNKFRIVRHSKGKKLFHNVADVYISRLVNSTPGSGVIGTMNYDRFAEQLERALKQPITIDADDTPDEIDRKQAVIETRAELKKMMDNGEDVAQVMREAESEMRRLWNYRRSLHLELANARKEGKFNSEDMRDYIDAANKMLTDNGMETLKHPEFWLRRLKHEEALGK